MSDTGRIVLLCSDGPSTRAVYNALRDEFGSVHVIMEEPISRLQMARRRANRLGYFSTVGQMLFVAGVVPILTRSSGERIQEIEREFNLRRDMPESEIERIGSVNSERACEVLRKVAPDVVVVNGTRIIGAETLACVDVPFINTHAGITPLYRGVHGAYWALAEGRPELVGTTVHFVDKGIDTGSIISQAFFEITERDNFATYPHLHTAAGITVLIPAVRDALEGRAEPARKDNGLESKLRYHPTIWGYLANRFRRGVR